MADTSVIKVQSKHSPKGDMGQKYLAAGVHLAMRLWENEPPGEAKPASTRDYETVGYVLSGRAELHLEGQKILLEAGDSISFASTTPHRLANAGDVPVHAIWCVVGRDPSPQSS